MIDGFLFLLFCAYFGVYSQTDYWKLYVTAVFQLFFRQLKNDQGLFLVKQSFTFSPIFLIRSCMAASLNSKFVINWLLI